jgi:O-antigen ligase
VRTVASRFVVVTLCLALVLSALAYGTVHYWALAVFELGAAALVVLWAVDAWRSRILRVSRSLLQLPLLGLFLLGLFQLLPLGGGGREAGGAISGPVAGSLSFDPYSTRLALVQVFALLVYFAAALAYIDSPKRLRLVARVVTVFGFALALFGLVQHFSSPNKIYWLKELPQSTPFGPFYNRHHFAGYMELAMALPLGLLFSGAVERDKRPLYIFAAAFMGIALVVTNSRGGLVAMAAEIVFLLILTGFRRGGEGVEEGARGARLKALVVRAGLAFVMVLALVGGALFFGGEAALSRIVGTVNLDDPTTGRAHFWSMTLHIIKDHPLAGTGLGSFGLAYTRYDTRNGLYRLEQTHNDYLQLASDAGAVGVALGLFFVVVLFRSGLARRETEDLFRRGVSTGALVGCFAVLVHSFFDFTLHTTSNALLFLVLAALATINGRVEEGGHHRRRRRRRRSIRQPDIPGVTEGAQLPPHGR